jgi:hypothetical protein
MLLMRFENGRNERQTMSASISKATAPPLKGGTPARATLSSRFERTGGDT